MLAMASKFYDTVNLPDEDEMWDMSPFSKFATSDEPLPIFNALAPDYKEFVYNRAYEYLHSAMYKGKYPKRK